MSSYRKYMVISNGISNLETLIPQALHCHKGFVKGNNSHLVGDHLPPGMARDRFTSINLYTKQQSNQCAKPSEVNADSDRETWAGGLVFTNECSSELRWNI